MSASIPNATAKTNRSGLVVIVDDEPFLLELAEVMLRSRGHRTRVFPSAETALAFLESEPEAPALLVTDYAMRALTGLDLIERGRRLHPSLKCLMVSGTVNQDVYRGVASKPDRFLAKPYQLAALNDMVDQLLQATDETTTWAASDGEAQDATVAPFSVSGTQCRP